MKQTGIWVRLLILICTSLLVQFSHAAVAPCGPDDISLISISEDSADATKLSWCSQPNTFYDVFYSEGLTPAEWMLASIQFVSQGATTEFIDVGNIDRPHPSLVGSRIYRIATQTDSDLDGLTDAFEILITETDPNKPDSDGDNTSDYFEDSNGDEILNFQEYQVMGENDPPTVLSPGPQTGLKNVSGTVPLSGISPGGGVFESMQVVTLSAASSETNIVQNPTVGPIINGQATLSYQPILNQIGTVTITVTADDGQSTNHSKIITFILTIENNTQISADIVITAGSYVSGCEESNGCLLPTVFVISLGEEVTWLNADTATHNVTSGTPTDGSDGVFASGSILVGNIFSYIFNQVGNFLYYDQDHPWIRGQIIVETPPSSSDCCESHLALGCDNPMCETAVCNTDPICCNFSWDGECAETATEVCADLCPSDPPIPLDTDVVIASDSSMSGCEQNNECLLPSTLRIGVGEDVTWYNKDAAVHRVTSGTPLDGPDGIFSSGSVFADMLFTHTFNQAGSFPYFDTVHPWIQGQIDVVEVMSTEPDDTLATAANSGISMSIDMFNTVGFIGDNPNLAGASGLDVDIIRVSLTAGTRIKVDVDADVNNSQLDSVLRLFDSTGKELAFSDDDAAPGESSSRDSFIEFSVTVPGVYYVGISGFMNLDYDPFIEGSGTPGSNGVYNIEITVSQDLSAISDVIILDGSSVSSCESSNECLMPMMLTIKMGEEVTWFNADTANHNITSGTASGGPDGLFASGSIVTSNIFSYTFNQVGSFPYYDIGHPSIQGQVTVVPPNSGDCCEVNGTVGCNNVVCETIVCSNDSSCCSISWDSVCVDQAATLCGGLCATFPVGTDVGIELGSNVSGCEVTSGCLSPTILRIGVGEEVTWFNADAVAHNVTSGTPDGGPDGVFTSGSIIASNTFSHTFNQAGSFPYYDTGHLWIQGQIDVVEVVSTEPDDTLATAANSGIGIGNFNTVGFIGDNPNLGNSSDLDVDLIRVSLTEGARIKIDVDASEIGSRLDSVIRLFDSAGNELAFSDDAPAPGETFSLDPYIDFPIEVTGVYYVGISEVSNFEYNPISEGSGTPGSDGIYDIKIVVTQ